MCRVFFLAGAALDGVKLVERTAGQFAGALQGQRANKGVFITTSGFSREAHEYAGIIPSKIILVGGEQLAALMVDHNVGVSPGLSHLYDIAAS